MAGHITKRGPNTWRIRINFGTDANGKRRSFNKTIHGSKKDAEKFLTAKLREKDLGEFVQPSAMTLDQFLDRWLSESAQPRLAKSSNENYTYLLKIYVRHILGARKILDIRLFDIQKLYNGLTTQGLSARTVRYVHTILSSAFSDAIKWQMLSVNPCANTSLPKREHREMKAFNDDEAKRFLAAAKNDRLGLIFAFALESGMRPEEYLGLKWSDLDFEKCTATIQRVLIRSKVKGGGWHFSKPKTPQSRRTVPMSQQIFARLKAHRTEQLAHVMKLGSEYERNDLVFANEFGRPIDLKNLRERHFKKIIEAENDRIRKINEEHGETLAGLPRIRLYDLRHSMATLMLANGINPKIVSERLGHASIVLTLDTYSHVLPNMQQDAVTQLEAALYG